MPGWALHLRAPAGPARLLGGQRHADQVNLLADSTAGFRLAVLACSLLGPRVRA